MNATGGSLGSGSLVSDNQQTTFDMAQESDVIALLKYVHQHPLDLDTKNELRDVVFSYRQSGAASDLQKAQDIFNTVGVTLLAKTGTQTAAPAPQVTSSTLGKARPKPRFTFTPQSVSKSETQQKQVVVETVTQKLKSVQQEVASTAPEVPQPVTPEVEVADSAELNKEPKKNNSEQTSVSTSDAVTRIQEIKREVNEKVGNPVNLISQNNTIGREYMNALLDAMKKVNGGTQNDVAEAMGRLERAFKSVDSVNVHVTKDAAPTTKKEEPKVVTEEKVVTVPVQSAEKKAEETNSASNAMPQPVTNKEPQASTPPRMSSVKESLQATQPQESVSAAPKPEPIVAPMPAQNPTTKQNPPAQVESDVSAHSVAKEKQVQDLLRLNRLKDAQGKKAQVETQISAMDPLMTPEVTSGLDQLLSEWVLFKNSGIFGTGPSGKDHPLYKKIAPLTMAAVIAGRFDGATPVIKQSITDYMNGWRYEEGIVHEHGETFEHYLRRVVKHILGKRQGS